ncbi:hypothetical protein D9613_004556 [Agrocybe pediades]|uniref:Uncharacterized protein n=1 Tax=Agrocybe pediades TaxID=84607 RepID=A0A8H4QIF5_9AGAR|nr:hypothetical protein D9613_004556 [Agrocybe pediades]
MLANLLSKNHKILHGIFEVCAAREEDIRTILSAVDELDTMPWLELKKEITEEKAPSWLTGSANTSITKENPNCATSGLRGNERLVRPSRSLRIIDKFSLDLSITCGFDYYTDIIYKVIVKANAPPGFKDADALTAALLFQRTFFHTPVSALAAAKSFK